MAAADSEDGDSGETGPDPIARFESLLDERLSRKGRTKKKVMSSSKAARARSRFDVDKAEDDEGEETEDGTVWLTSQPACIGGKMRDYQLEGLNWMISLHTRGLNGILADEMGLGKTLQSISLLGYLTIEAKVKQPHLVVVPLTVLGNWLKELNNWCPKLRAVRLHGNKDERKAVIDSELFPGKFDVLVTTYECVASEQSSLRKIRWCFLVVDEAHRLKNEQSRLSVVLRSMHVSHRLLLTGTPIQNNLHELWALLNFLFPSIFDTSEPFDSSFDSKAGHVTVSSLDRLQRLLHGVMLRRLKSEVEKGLPPKKEVKLFLPLSPMQAEWYRKVLLRDLSSADGKVGSGVKVHNIVMHLRKVCNHPYLFEGAEPGPPFVEGEHLVTNSGKLLVLDKLLSRLKAEGHRVLIFTTMARMLDVLEDYLRYRQYTYCRLDGSTTTAEREEMMSEYNAPGSSKFLFLLSTRAGGLGINLVSADTVILYDSDWNPQADLQAQDRAHRIGQTRPVTVYRLLMEQTLEEKIIERAERKLYLDRMLIEQGRLSVRFKGAAKEELLGMIKFGADVILKSDGAAITDADIDALIKKGTQRANELDARIKADCKHTLANFSMDNGGDPSKLYELDGVEYDAKGMADLIRKLKNAQNREKAGGGRPRPRRPTGEDGDEGEEGDAETLMHDLLVGNWPILRTLRMCNEPGAPPREGRTVHDIVQMRVAEMEEADKLAEANDQAKLDAQARCAYYTFDKREAPERSWPMVVGVLEHLGFEGLDASDPSSRTATIPAELCANFDSRVVEPWQAAWRTFRASQRSRGGANDSDSESRDGAARAPSAGAQDGAPPAAETISDEATAAAAKAAEEAAIGDSIYTWGCLDWLSTTGRAAEKKSERYAFIVAAPDLLQSPDGLPASLASVRIKQVAAGGRHIMMLTASGDVYAWGRGLSGCLGVVALGCAGIPQPISCLSLAGIKIALISCGGEHSFLIATDGQLYSCGSNKRGQLGLGGITPEENVTLPQRVVAHLGGSLPNAASTGKVGNPSSVTISETSGAADAKGCRAYPRRAVSVSCGNAHTAVVLADGSLLTCGAADDGVLGQEATSQSRRGASSISYDVIEAPRGDAYTLASVAGLTPSKTPVIMASAGGLHTLALTKGAQVYAFGAGTWGRLGLGDDNSPKSAPTLVKAASHLSIVEISAGYEHSLLLSSDGSVFVFGRTPSSYVSLPTVVPTIGPSSDIPIRSISAGRGWSLAVDRDGGLWVWGAMPQHGAMGLGENNGSKIRTARQPTRIPSLVGRHVVSAAAGSAHVIALADSARSSNKDMVIPAEARFGTTSLPTYDHAVCESCGRDDGPDGGDLLFCDWCNRGFHPECHEPKLSSVPEGDWICFVCKLERFSSCEVCGMQDELSSTLALCDTAPDCPHHGCCHVECLPAHRRPPLLPEPAVKEVGSKRAGATAGPDAETDGASGEGADADAKSCARTSPTPFTEGQNKEEGPKRDDAAADAENSTSKPVAPAAGGPMKPGKKATGKGATAVAVPEKLRWDVSQLHWFCVECERKRRDDGKITDEKEFNGQKTPARPPQSAGMRAELGLPARKLLRQYYEICKKPDEHQIALLAATTQRDPTEVAAWFMGLERAELDKARRQRLEQQREKMEVERTTTAAAGPAPQSDNFASTAPPLSRGNSLPSRARIPAPLPPHTERSIDDLRSRGNEAYKLGKLDDAKQLYMAAIKLDTDFASAHASKLCSNLSAVFAAQTDWSNSLRYAETCVRIQPDFAKGWSRIGTAYASLHMPDKALAAFRRCLALDPQNTITRDRILQLERERGTFMPSANSGFSSQVSSSGNCAQVGSVPPVAGSVPPIAMHTAMPTAVPMATAVPAKRPMLGAPSDAPQAKRAHPNAPTTPPAAASAASIASSESAQYVAAGNTAYREEKFGAAVDAFSHAIGCYKKLQVAPPAALLSNRSAAYAGLHMYAEALNDAESCIRVNPQWSKGYSRRGNALQGLGRIHEAIDAYQRSLKFDPSNRIVTACLNTCYETLDNRARLPTAATATPIASASPSAPNHAGPMSQTGPVTCAATAPMQPVSATSAQLPQPTSTHTSNGTAVEEI